MNENRVKAIINECVGFERKHIEIIQTKENFFGGLARVIFKVKNETYKLTPTEEGFFFDFYDEEAPYKNEDEAEDANVSRETYEAGATEAEEAPTEA